MWYEEGFKVDEDKIANKLGYFISVSPVTYISSFPFSNIPPLPPPLFIPVPIVFASFSWPAVTHFYFLLSHVKISFSSLHPSTFQYHQPLHQQHQQSMQMTSGHLNRCVTQSQTETCRNSHISVYVCIYTHVLTSFMDTEQHSTFFFWIFFCNIRKIK